MSDLGIDVSKCDGDLVITGETRDMPLRCPAWWVTDLTQLYQGGARRGADRVIPATTGVRPYRRRRTATAYPLPMVILGDVDVDGLTHADVWSGWQANYELLHDELIVDPGSVEGTRLATFTTADGSVRSGQVHVLAIDLGLVQEGRAKATLQLSIPSGRLE